MVLEIRLPFARRRHAQRSPQQRPRRRRQGLRPAGRAGPQPLLDQQPDQRAVEARIVERPPEPEIGAVEPAGRGRQKGAVGSGLGPVLVRLDADGLLLAILVPHHPAAHLQQIAQAGLAAIGQAERRQRSHGRRIEVERRTVGRISRHPSEQQRGQRLADGGDAIAPVGIAPGTSGGAVGGHVQHRHPALHHIQGAGPDPRHEPVEVALHSLATRVAHRKRSGRLQPWCRRPGFDDDRARPIELHRPRRPGERRQQQAGCRDTRQDPDHGRPLQRRPGRCRPVRSQPIRAGARGPIGRATSAGRRGRAGNHESVRVDQPRRPSPIIGVELRADPATAGRSVRRDATSFRPAATNRRCSRIGERTPQATAPTPGSDRPTWRGRAGRRRSPGSPPASSRHRRLRWRGRC